MPSPASTVPFCVSAMFCMPAPEAFLTCFFSVCLGLLCNFFHLHAMPCRRGGHLLCQAVSWFLLGFLWITRILLTPYFWRAVHMQFWAGGVLSLYFQVYRCGLGSKCIWHCQNQDMQFRLTILKTTEKNYINAEPQKEKEAWRCPQMVSHHHKN